MQFGLSLYAKHVFLVVLISIRPTLLENTVSMATIVY